MKKINKENLIRNLCIILCILFASIYLVNRQIKINIMEKDLEEVKVMNKNLENLNEDLEVEIDTVQDIIKELENN